MYKKTVACALVLLMICGLQIHAQQKTEVRDAKARAMLIGRHKLSLQWISWDFFGTANVSQKGRTLYLKGRQDGRGENREDYLTVDGIITSISAKEFKFDGKIITRISHINGGAPCVREGEMTFRITGKRRYWRLQEIDNPCDEAADYVDIFFK
jgi:hypothetical protein